MATRSVVSAWKQASYDMKMLTISTPCGDDVAVETKFKKGGLFVLEDMTLQTHLFIHRMFPLVKVFMFNIQH